MVDQLLLPDNDCQNPVISIVIPALNEALTIGKFIDWCMEGLNRASVQGEILIIDSSSDRTAQIAREKGARVLVTPKRGLGRAYIDSIPYIRGKYILMGDCDCTYDFREISPFIQKFEDGFEFIMGSRFKGSIEKNAMPLHHQYFGSPMTTMILNIIYHSGFSDINCGMRGISKDALVRMDLHSQSWEYASEMIIKSIHMELRTCEVPVNFYKDIKGRVSNLKRIGWRAPWHAGWISLKAMFIYGSDFFLRMPGIIMLIVGLFFFIPLTFGPYSIGPVTFSLGWMLFWLCIVIIGIQSFLISIIAECMYDYNGKNVEKWVKVFEYDRTFFISIILFTLGVCAALLLVFDYLKYGLSMPLGLKPVYYYSITGLLGIIAAFQIFTFTQILHSFSILTDNGAKLWKR